MAAHDLLAHSGSNAEQLAICPTDVVTVTARPDPVLDDHPQAIPTASNGALVWWTPILGPTATLMAHRFAALACDGEPATFSGGELARTFGLGESMTRLRSALARLERFDVTASAGGVIAVRLWLPPLSPPRLAQLPDYLARAYTGTR